MVPQEPFYTKTLSVTRFWYIAGAAYRFLKLLKVLMCLLLRLLLSASHRHDGRQNVRWRERIRRPVCRHIQQLVYGCDYTAKADVGVEVTLRGGANK
jgi:hypothetical protein